MFTFVPFARSMQASDENINEFGVFVKICFHSEHYIDRRWDYWPELSNSGREKNHV